jgi:polyvinyl alcohol dehydrogenase (cytochrome)
MFGRDLAGSHYNPIENLLTPTTVGRLREKWTFKTGGNISSEPIVIGDVVYFGSWDGKEYAVDAKTGKKLWEFDAGGPSRACAAYGDGVLFFGTFKGWLYALSAETGDLKWKIRIDTHNDAVATGSPIYYRERVYIGVSSLEEFTMMTRPDRACCTFRGSVVAYDAHTGRQIWRFHPISEPAADQGKDSQGHPVYGPSGAAVWSTIAIHPETDRLYLTTGNQYTNPETQLSDAIIALELSTGKLVWSYQATSGDRWTAACRNDPECGPDFDFGTTPISFRGRDGKALVGAGQKSGWFYALDARDGKLAWKTQVGPGGKLGGILFGNATDGERVYVGISNLPKQGSLSALAAATGQLLWQTPSPDGGANLGPITVTGTGDNRLVFAGSFRGFVRAYNARTGKIAWEFDTNGAVGGGLTVVDGVLYVGSGYLRLGGKSNTRLFAFSIEGK